MANRSTRLEGGSIHCTSSIATRIDDDRARIRSAFKNAAEDGTPLQRGSSPFDSQQGHLKGCALRNGQLG
jgi:hypothetical protein